MDKGEDGKNDGEPKDPFGEVTKYECLTYEPLCLLRQIFRMVNKLFCVLRKYLSVMGCIFGKPNIKRGSGAVNPRIVIRRVNIVNKLLNLSRRCS